MTKKTGFTTISIKHSVVVKFRRFSKKIAPNHSEALGLMLDFFQNNEISPRENLGPTGRTLEGLIKKRNNAVIAIIRNMEKNGVNPTLGMMHTLFDGITQVEDEKPLMREKKMMKEMEGRPMFREKKKFETD